MPPTKERKSHSFSELRVNDCAANENNPISGLASAHEGLQAYAGGHGSVAAQTAPP
jgi:hypothetical protein